MFQYPLSLSFKVIALAPQVRVTDASGNLVLYIRQKLLALKEDVKIFADEKQSQLLFQLKADRIIDFSAQYNITNSAGQLIGSVKRQGMRSIFKATFDIKDAAGNAVGVIREENAWIKVIDAIVSEIPFVGMFINPAYLVEMRGQTVFYMKKQPALFEGKFNLEKRAEMSKEDEELALASSVMMMMLERSRG